MDTNDRNVKVQILNHLEGVICTFPFTYRLVAEAHVKSLTSQPSYEACIIRLLGPQGEILQQWPPVPVAYCSETFTVETSELDQLLRQMELVMNESKRIIANSRDLRAKVRRMRRESRSLSRKREDVLASLFTKWGS